ncbi:MAG: HAD hydrolase-like protein [bacterium]|nr:HAD hydrolase-like protein [bacterium]
MKDEKSNFVLFDFDGVIADSFSAAFAINQTRCPHLTADEYRARFSGNINDWKKTKATSHTKECRSDIDFFTEYVPKMKVLGVFPGMLEAIQELSRLYTLIIISSTLTSPIKEFVERQGIGACFTEIMGKDVHESKARKIEMVFSKYGVDKNSCVFVTDTLGDMREAAHLDVGSIGVSWGFQNEETLRLGNPFCIVQKPEEFPPAIARYFEGDGVLL